MHPLIDAILTSQTVHTPDGRALPVHSNFSRAECELLYRVVAAVKPRVAIEVGMAFGVSTVCLCDALQRAAVGYTPRLIGMDPAQRGERWQGVGLYNVAQAGFSGLLEFHERASQEVLPELVARGVRAELAFLDGYHTFDHTLVDFFYVDRLLTTGGIVVLDDVQYPAIQAVARFVLSNRDYELAEIAVAACPPKSGVKQRVKQFLAPLARTDHTPAAEHRQLFESLSRAEAVALRKRGDDTRPWDHYAPF